MVRIKTLNTEEEEEEKNETVSFKMQMGRVIFVNNRLVNIQ